MAGLFVFLGEKCRRGWEGKGRSQRRSSARDPPSRGFLVIALNLSHTWPRILSRAVGNFPRGESAMIKLSLYGNYAKHGNTGRDVYNNAHSPAATIPSLLPSPPSPFSPFPMRSSSRTRAFVPSARFLRARRPEVNNNCVHKKLLQTQRRENSR